MAVTFPDSDANPVEWRVGISYISVEQARRNVEEQIPAWNFAAVKSRRAQRVESSPGENCRERRQRR